MATGQGIGVAPLAFALALAFGGGFVVPARAAGPAPEGVSAPGAGDRAVPKLRRTATLLLAQAGADGASAANDLDFDSRLRRADALMRAGKAAEAYALLSAVEFDGAGIIEFDYLLGASGVDSGHADRATLALERILAQDPNHAGARIELGRAYVAMGDDADARREFEQTLSMNPPEFARTKVARYLADIDRRAHSRRWSWTAYVSAGIGHDSNVNASPSDSAILVPGGSTVVAFAADNLRLADRVMTGGLGGELRYALNDRTETFVGWDGSLRLNAKRSEFDLGTSDGHVGVARSFGPHVLQATLVGGEFYLDRNVYRRLLGGALEWRHAVNERNRITPFLQYNELRYPSASSLNTAQTLYGASWLHAFGTDGRHALIAGVFGLHESDVDGNLDGVHDGLGWRLGAQVALKPGLNLFASLMEVSSTYSRVELGYPTGVRRGDHRHELTVALDWAFAPDWTLRPQLTRTQQDSNIKFYDYTRTEAFLTVRRDFR